MNINNVAITGSGWVTSSVDERGGKNGGSWEEKRPYLYSLVSPYCLPQTFPHAEVISMRKTLVTGVVQDFPGEIITLRCALRKS